MKKYHVILTSLVNAFRDVEEENPETKEYHFDIEASSKEDAIKKAKDQHDLSVYESEAYED